MILNVDDDEANRYAKSRILKRAGYEVIEAGTGTDALRLVKETRPELVLLGGGTADHEHPLHLLALKECRARDGSAAIVGTADAGAALAGATASLRWRRPRSVSSARGARRRW